MIKVPIDICAWISGMVDGTEHVCVGHMMFSTNENFRTESFEEGLSLIKNSDIVRKWIEEGTGAEKLKRFNAVRDFTADAIHRAVIRDFKTATYPGD